mgnify:CR=1 FL=1|jgi:hypothetical protein
MMTGPKLTRQKTRDMSAKTTTLFSKDRPSSFSAPKTSLSPMSLATCTLFTIMLLGFGLTRRSHICFELLKNSLRAVVERYGVENEDSFPPIKVVVVEGSEDITIKISDEGGGIPRSAIPMIWT